MSLSIFGPCFAPTKENYPLTGGRDHGEGLVFRERAQNYLDLKLCVYQLIEAGGVGGGEEMLWSERIRVSV